MSNLKVGDRVRHMNGGKGAVISEHYGINGRLYALVQLDRRLQSTCIWPVDHTKPIVTVRG